MGRFLSADTLIPNPANPQSYNRYSYVLNSPLNFTDPTGHCAGVEGDPGSEGYDAECWDYLENEFCNNLSCDEFGWRTWIIIHNLSIWTKDELVVTRNALLAVKNALQDIDIIDWRSRVGFTRFTSREFVTYHNNETGEINLGPDLFSKGNIYNHIFGAVHEIGHAIDSNVGYTLAQAMLENAGAEHSYFLGWDLGINKDGFCFRSHACNAYSETWADAFAFFAMEYGRDAFDDNIPQNIVIYASFASGPLADSWTLDAIWGAYNNGDYGKMIEAVSTTLAP